MDNFLAYTIKVLLVMAVLSAAIPAYSGEASEAFVDESEAIEGVFTYKSTSQLRSTFSSSVKRFSRGGKVFNKITEQGKGDYHKYEDVTWESEADIEEKDGLIYIVYSLQIIRDKAKNILVKYEKHFDYDKKEIYYTASDGEGNIIMERTFPVKGKIADNISVIYFLGRFGVHRGQKAYRSFYLITNEPRFYRVNVKAMGSEELELPIGRVKAAKLRLIPDMGPLTGLVGVFIPPTYVWYAEEPPYNWLQYEGLETGLGSAHIVAAISSTD